MRAILDTNTLISMVLSSNESSSTMWRLFQYAVSGDFQPVLLEEVEDEFLRVVDSKPYLQRVIGPVLANQFIQQLREISHLVARIELPAWVFARDPQDDFLIAYALIFDIDYIVTGDKDLLVLQSLIERIVSPAEFLELIEASKSR
jgi:putative PIN family toxin of toxin-antitoxin system